MNWTESKSKSKFIGRSCGRVTFSSKSGWWSPGALQRYSQQWKLGFNLWVWEWCAERNGTESLNLELLDLPGALETYKSWNRATLEPCAVTVQPWKNILELWVPTPDPCKSGTVLWMLGFSWYGSLPWNLGTRALELRNSGVLELWNPETLASSTWLETQSPEKLWSLEPCKAAAWLWIARCLYQFKLQQLNCVLLLFCMALVIFLLINQAWTLASLEPRCLNSWTLEAWKPGPPEPCRSTTLDLTLES